MDRILSDEDQISGDDPPENPPEESRGSFLYELPGLLLAALVVAVVIKTFVIQPFYMVSKVNDLFGDIERGEILVFENPYRIEEEESVPEAVVRSVLEALGIRTSPYDDLVKRVVALEGEEIQIRDSQVLFDGVVIDEPYLNAGTLMPDFGPDRYFMMGDNRNSSSDGRVFGPIPVDDVIGEAVIRIWPLERLGGL